MKNAIERNTEPKTYVYATTCYSPLPMSCYSGNCWEVKRYKNHDDFFQLQLQIKARNIKQARIITDFVINNFLGVLSVETNCCIYSRKSAEFQIEKLFIEENAAFKDSNEDFMDGYPVNDKGILTISKKCIKVLDKILEEAKKRKN
ncbi:hypothetical protein EFE32_10360 [Lactococcus lactis subsp. lactis]|uniref:hypothetical protein n=1 Tax=Lactococcus lactis TaxID=1358 RepID=UPI00223BE70D|nr:hypothetical protein [Lactococcus lactis]MCT0017218.1 hypothetical protein [Lactococcus lactis subsp. lactis]